MDLGNVVHCVGWKSQCQSGTRIEPNPRGRSFQAFLLYQDVDDMKHRRRLIQLTIHC
jgi:hypothetical protein